MGAEDDRRGRSLPGMEAVHARHEKLLREREEQAARLRRTRLYSFGLAGGRRS